MHHVLWTVSETLLWTCPVASRKPELRPGCLASALMHPVRSAKLRAVDIALRSWGVDCRATTEQTSIEAVFETSEAKGDAILFDKTAAMGVCDTVVSCVCRPPAQPTLSQLGAMTLNSWTMPKAAGASHRLA